MKFSKFFLPALSLIGFVVLVNCTSCDTTGGEGESAPALFAFQDNLAATFDTQVPVSIEVYSKDIANIDLVINDSIVKSWNKPTSKLTFNVNTSVLGIGAKTMDLVVKYNNGESFTDHRLIRVLSDIVPEVWSLSIVNEFPHNTLNFTQGLEFSSGTLYEGTGQLGQSKVAKIDVATGNDIVKMGLDGSQFGEGITILGETLYQITWTTGRCFTYDKNTLQPKAKEFMTPGVQYSISDLVLGLMGIKAPCHGYTETKQEQKFRDGVAKPLIKAVLENMGTQTVGTGAQTKYMVEPQLPSLITLDEVDEA